jgi:hypothetical protein
LFFLLLLLSFCFFLLTKWFAKFAESKPVKAKAERKSTKEPKKSKECSDKLSKKLAGKRSLTEDLAIAPLPPSQSNPKRFGYFLFYQFLLD